MPGIVTHLVIADKVICQLPQGSIKSKEKFLAGTIAPDSVHARSDYKREYKKLSHLRQGILDADFHKDEFYELYRSRLNDFVNKKIQKDNKQLDIDLGYLVHLIADESFILTVRKELVIELEKVSISQTEKEFIPYISSVMNNTDLRLVNEYQNIEMIRDHLNDVEPFELEGYLSEKELTISRDWVVRKYLKDMKDYEEPKIISSKRMNKYIEEVADEIAGYITELLRFIR